MKTTNGSIYLQAFLFLCSTACLAQPLAVTHPLTFQQALEISLGNNHALKQVDALKKEKHQESLSAKGLYLPKIGLSASYMAMSDNLHLDLTDVRDAITPLYQVMANYGRFSGVPNPDPATSQQMPILPDDISTQVIRAKMQEGLSAVQSGDWDPVLQKKQFSTVDANLQWPLYTGGKIRVANKVAEIRESEVDAVREQKSGELISELAERYFGLCLANQALKVRQDVLKGMDQHLDDAVKMEKQGMIANVDVLHARVYQSQANREFLRAQRNCDVVNQALLNTLAMDENLEVETLSQLFYLDTIEPLQYFAESARKNNPLLQQVISRKEQAGLGVKAEKAGFLPDIALQGTYNVANHDLSAYAPDWIVGVGMKWTLFDGASRLRKLNASGFRVNQVEQLQMKSESDVSTLVYKLYQELNMYHEQLLQLETARDFADEYLRAREETFHSEMSNSTELMDAKLALAQVKIERLQAMYSYDLTLAKLLEAAGISGQFEVYQLRAGVKTEKYQN
ncbi:MAG: TolC family protein [Bacteroidetes bacterium]|nr:TolC family protein [Bacteroidota bacterium]